MKYYIDREIGEVYAYEADGSQDAFIKVGLEPLSDEELAEIRAAQAAAMEPTPEQVKAEAYAQRDSLLAMAALRIAPLQDAIDLGEDEPGDSDLLRKWKAYRVAVNRIDKEPGFPSAVSWPAQPY